MTSGPTTGRSTRSPTDRSSNTTTTVPFFTLFPKESHPDVLLHCTLDTALERVATDQDRVLSSYPEFLRATYQRVEELLPTMPASEWQFDTTTIDAQSIVDELAKALVLD